MTQPRPAGARGSGSTSRLTQVLVETGGTVPAGNGMAGVGVDSGGVTGAVAEPVA